MWCTWLLPLLLLLGAALIGGLIGWLLRGNKIEKIREEYQAKIDVLNQSIKIEKEAKAKIQVDYDNLKKLEGEWNTKIISVEADASNWKQKANSNKAGWDGVLLRLKDWENKYNEKDKAHQEATATTNTLNNKIDELDAKLKQLDVEANSKLEAAHNKASELEAKLNEIQGQEADAAGNLANVEAKFKAQIQELNEKIEDQNSELYAWDKKYDKIREERDTASKNYQLLETTTKMELEGIKKDKDNEIARLQDLLDAAKNNAATTSQLTKLEQLIAQLQSDNKEANDEIERLKALLAQLKEAPQKEEVDAAKPLTKEEKTLQRIKEKAKDIDFERIGIATYADRDDLKIIKGIGPFIEKKLHALGIYTFWQIANLNLEDEEKVNEAIEFFPGRIRRDEWVRQGGELHKEKEKEEDEK